MKAAVLVSAAFAAIVSAGAAGGDFVSAAPGGELRINPSGTVLAPVLMDGGWTTMRCRGPLLPGGDGSYAFAIVDGAGAEIVSGAAAARIEGGRVLAKWEFEFKREFTANAFGVGASMPVGVFAGGEFNANGTKVALPVERPEKAFLLGAAKSDFTVTAPGGGGWSVRLPKVVWAGLQDNRIWNGGDYSLRLVLATGAVAAGAKFSLEAEISSPAGFDRLESGPVRISAGADWIPVADSTDIVAGSALDFSRQGWIDAPAGKHGRVVAVGDGFEFERRPGRQQRFYGVNLCFSANFMDAPVADELARRLARHGYNALRLHHYDGGLVEGSPDGTAVNPGRMAKLDHLLNACIANGIYLTTDLFVSRPVPWRAIGVDRAGSVPMDDFKQLCLVDGAAYSNLCAFARGFLAHVNPATGRSWAAEPALAWIAFINEGNPGNHGFGIFRDNPAANARWREWLKAKRAADPAYADVTEEVPGNPWDKSRQVDAFCEFVADVEADFDRRFTAFLRDELGCRALFSNLSSWYNPPSFQRVREAYDYVDDHFYVDHPQFIEQPWRLPSRCDNVNPARFHPGGLEAIERRRLAGKPFTVTEFNFSAPGRWRGVGGIMLGAQAARLGYDAVWRFAWSHDFSSLMGVGRIGYFDTATDPLARAAERAAMCLFLRGGDVGESRADGVFAVTSAHTCGFSAEGGRAEAGPLAAEVSGAPAAVWASSLDGRPLAKSAHILVSHVTDVQDEGVTYADAERKVLVKWGDPPHLMRRGRARVTLSLPGIRPFRVFALASDGSRRGVVPALWRDGRLVFEADTARDPAAATFLYELIR